MVAQLDTVAKLRQLKRLPYNARRWSGQCQQKTKSPSSSGTIFGEFNSADKLLGNAIEDITRRDFLNATLLASGGMLLNPVSPAAVAGAKPRARIRSKTTGPAMAASATTRTPTATRCRTRGRAPDSRWRSLKVSPRVSIDTGETYDCVVVGGGISGLAAALIFQRKAGEGKTCLVLDNHPIFGGEAKRNEFLVDGHRLIGASGLGTFPGSISSQLHRTLLRLDRAEDAAPRISEVGRPAPGDASSARTPYLGAAPNGLYFGAKVRPAAGTLADRSVGQASSKALRFRRRRARSC